MISQMHKLPTAISGGQQQRAAIARALANDPPIIVADEPTGNLDSKTADAVFTLFTRLVDEGKTILMVTHDDELAHRVTRTVTIADGAIVDDRLSAKVVTAVHKESHPIAPAPEPTPAPLLTPRLEPVYA
jgi:putative ABC transport system ATP-binding protein